MKKIISLFAIVLVVSGCAIERAKVADEAKTALLGRTKTDILNCMGAPENRQVIEGTEIWTYHGVHETDSSSYGFSRLVGNSTFFKNTMRSRYTNYGYEHGRTRERSCKIGILFRNGYVSKVTYTGRTGGYFTQNEACAAAVKNC